MLSILASVSIKIEHYHLIARILVKAFDACVCQSPSMLFKEISDPEGPAPKGFGGQVLKPVDSSENSCPSE